MTSLRRALQAPGADCPRQLVGVPTPSTLFRGPIALVVASFGTHKLGGRTISCSYVRHCIVLQHRRHSSRVSSRFLNRMGLNGRSFERISKFSGHYS